MTVDVRRSTRGTLFSLLSLVLFLAAGSLLLSREYMATRPSALLAVIGFLQLLWAGVIANGLRRPVLMSADAAGVRMRSLTGYQAFAWKDLVFANFDGSDRAFVLGGLRGGRMRYAALSKRNADPQDLAAMKTLFARHRPELPEQMVQPGAGPGPTEETPQ